MWLWHRRGVALHASSPADRSTIERGEHGRASDRALAVGSTAGPSARAARSRSAPTQPALPLLRPRRARGGAVCLWVARRLFLPSSPITLSSPPRRESLRPGNNPSLAAPPAVRCVTPRARPRALAPPAPAADSAFSAPHSVDSMSIPYILSTQNDADTANNSEKPRRAADSDAARRGAMAIRSRSARARIPRNPLSLFHF